MPTPLRAERVNPRLRCCCRSRDDAEDAIAGPHAVYSHVVAEFGAVLLGESAQDDVVDFGGVDILARVQAIEIGGVLEASGGDEVSGKGVGGALDFGGAAVVVLGEVTDDLTAGDGAAVGVQLEVEGGLAGRAVGIRGAVDVDGHRSS